MTDMYIGKIKSYNVLSLGPYVAQYGVQRTDFIYSLMYLKK